jgi:tRNA(Ile)-lysidine synthase
MIALKFQVFKSLDQLIQKPISTVVVGVSGGADSMALTLLAKEYVNLKGGNLQAVTVDHQIRPESSEEALWVKQTLQCQGIEHQTLLWHHADDLNRRHERARTARYQLLVDFCKNYQNPVLLTAHHQQDQVETILMLFLKGTGPAGFQGIQAQRLHEGVQIVRPLLDVSPDQLRLYLKNIGITWVEDSSNYDTFYERTRIRALVEQISPKLGITGILASASKVYEQQQNFEILTAEYAESFVTNFDLLTINQEAFFRCPEKVQQQWLRQQIWKIGMANYPKPIATIMAILQIIKQPRVNGYKVSGCIINVTKGLITFNKIDL